MTRRQESDISNGTLYRSAALHAIAPFVVGCAVAIGVSWFYHSKLETKTVFELENWIVAAFFLNTSIIFFGTIEFVYSEFVHNKKAQDGLGKFAVVFGIAALVICAADVAFWYAFINLKCQPPNLNCDLQLSERLHTSELMSLSIFVSFFMIDALLLKSASRSQDGSEKRKREFFIRCLWIVDIPVVVIVLSVLAIRHYVFGDSIRITEQGVRYFDIINKVITISQEPDRTYRRLIGDGFAAGAILAHILLSQLAFTFLKWEYHVGTKRAEHEKVTSNRMESQRHRVSTL